MTGGIAPDATDWWDYWWQYVVEARYNILRDNLIPPPASSAGEYSYSNLGYMVAGAMAERVTGKSWESLMEERLFAPLGMTAAKPSFQEGPYYKVDQPWGHWRNEGGPWTPRWFALPPAWGPAGNAHVSIEAWTQFIRLWFLDSEPAILDRSSLDELIGADFITPTPYTNTYGAGWRIFTDESTGEVVISHDGLSCCWATWLRVLPHRGVAYIAAANARFMLSTGELLSSIIDHLIEQDSPRSAGLSPAVKNYMLAPHGGETDMALQPLNQRTTPSPNIP